MKIIVGFITYNQNSFKYLPFFLPSLKSSLMVLKDDYEIFVLDNSVNFGGNQEYISKFAKENNLDDKISFFSLGFNSGFAKGFNFLINKSIAIKADLFMAINPDTILEESSISKLIKKFNNDDKISSLTPKILNWDFVNNKKTNIIDSLGIGIDKFHHFFDIGQGKIDNNNQSIEVFGASGAAVVYNIKALQDVAFDNGKSLEFFDELMFMYKEDVDLSYRLRLAGWKSFIVSESIIYHDRSLSSLSYNVFSLIFKKKDSFRSLSYLNQLIVLLKFRKLNFSFKIRFFSFLRFFLLVFYGLFFNFVQIKQIIKLMPEIEKRRKHLKIIEYCVQDIERLIKKA